MRIVLMGLFCCSIAAAAPPELTELRENVRKLANSKDCVRCHMPGQPGALQRILDIYNLRNTFWSASLDEGRLLKFRERMRDILSDGAEFKLVETFVKKEIAYRRAEPGARSDEIERNKRERALNELGILQF